MRKFKLIMPVFASLLLMVVLNGCASLQKGTRFYSGTPLQRSEVSLVITPMNCFINNITEVDNQETKRLESRNILELLPGNYIIGLAYMNIYEHGASKIYTTINCRAGHSYIIVPHITTYQVKTVQGNYVTEKKWEPILYDISSNSDYAKIFSEDNESQDYYKKKIDHYFEDTMGRKTIINKGIYWF